MPVVEIENLNVTYGDLDAVKDLTLSADSGEVLVVLGSNGAGKTSTIECAQGIRTPTSGQIKVLGLSPTGDRSKLMTRIGVMPQDGGLPQSARPAEILAYYQRLFGQQQNPELLDRLGLASRASMDIRHLSGGEKQRLSLALSLVAQPEVLFLDEPTSGVDAQGRALIREIVSEQKLLGTTIVLTTHELEEAERIADRVAIVHQGELLALGPLNELLGNNDKLRFKAKPGLKLEQLALEMGCQVVESSAGLYELDTDRSASSLAELTTFLAKNDIELEELLAKRETLEDFFLRLTQEAA